tara:strand:+ start:2955 stop:3677 length:723 start_codon:yes stop_codon:yes gene_type:complete
MKILKSFALVLGFISLNLFSMHHESSNEDVARGWIEAGYTGKDEAIAYVKKHMAEDGRNYPGRYVGFGFTYNPDAEPGTMVITAITPESPASEVLKVGDRFTSVNGVEVNEANMDRLNFRGKPGEEVNTTLERDGNTLTVSVARGIISANYSKLEVLDNMESGNADEWVPEESNVIEVLSNASVVYVLHQSKDIEPSSGLPFEAVSMHRFTFNESGKVASIRNLSEDRFVLEQQGYTISR